MGRSFTLPGPHLVRSHLQSDLPVIQSDALGTWMAFAMSLGCCTT